MQVQMSKSLKRVRAALTSAGLATEIVELGETRTAQQAADAAGCHVDQIAKSVIFRGASSDAVLLFLTAGGNRVSPEKAAAVAGEALAKADAAFIRERTGFAIGGVSPFGHPGRPRAFCDPRLTEFAEIWAAAGTPRHIFRLTPRQILTETKAQLADFTE